MRVNWSVHAVLLQQFLFTAGNGGLVPPQRDKLGPVEVLSSNGRLIAQ